MSNIYIERDAIVRAAKRIKEGAVVYIVIGDEYRAEITPETRDKILEDLRAMVRKMDRYIKESING